MLIEMHVFFRGKLSRAFKELGFPFAIKPATGSLEQQCGYMPTLLRRDETGVQLWSMIQQPWQNLATLAPT